MDPLDLAKQFTQFYYNTFDSNRSNLASLYRERSMLTFEGAQILGASAIVEKLVSLSFQKVRHNVVTIDAQPSTGDNAIIVSITGQLLVDDEDKLLPFNQVFQLAQADGSYYVHNDIFRLNYG